MNIIEILKQIFSATDEQTTAFNAAMKENNIFTTSHENMDVRYPKMKTDFEGAVQERDAANATIAELKKAAKGQADMQAIITNHEGTIQKLTEQLAQEKLNAAIKVGLLSEKAVDVDYLTFKLNEKLKGDGEALTLDDNGNIKGWKDKVDGLRTQFPNMFEAANDGSNPDGYEVVPLPLRKGSGGNDAPTKESFRNMTYEQRVALKQQNESLYRQLRGN
jgi:hypothetical protein